MARKYGALQSPTRRDFLATTGAAVAALSSSSLLVADSNSPTSRYRRLNLKSKDAEPHLKSYERAVAAMLELPFSDSRNWYRHALIHTMDCPHANWWFLPWHRGYTGWLEQICRELSGDSDFAMPYWDWTQEAKLPERFLVGKLNPANFNITGFADFKSKARSAISAFWDSLTPLQITQLSLRAYPAEDLLWAGIEDPPGDGSDASMFSDISFVRQQGSPWMDEMTANAVASSTIKDALSSKTFESFGSGKLGYHSASNSKVQGILESQPHNLVHNWTGGILAGPPDRIGFMTDFLSPVDPIFFMHHANIDRLWDVWTRRQLANGNPNLPADPNDLKAWKDEPFLFFVGHDGKPIHQQTSGDYISTDFFAYDYEPGSGEETVKKTSTTGVAAAAVSKRVASILPQSPSASNQAIATAKVPAALSATAAAKSDIRIVAQISVELPPNSRNLRLHVLVNAPASTRSVGFNSPYYAGTYQQFGGHHSGDGHRGRELTFSIGLSKAVERLTAAKKFDVTGDMKVTVVADWPGVSLSAPIKVTRVEIIAQ